MMMLERFDHFGACLTLLVYYGTEEAGWRESARKVPKQQCTPDVRCRVKSCGREVWNGWSWN